MAEQMNEMQLMFQERQNTGTAWTRNEEFDKNGYLVNFEDTYSMLRKIQSIAQDNELQNRLALRALKDSERFDFEEYVDFLIRLQFADSL